MNNYIRIEVLPTGSLGVDVHTKGMTLALTMLAVAALSCIEYKTGAPATAEDVAKYAEMLQFARAFRTASGKPVATIDLSALRKAAEQHGQM